MTTTATSSRERIGDRAVQAGFVTQEQVEVAVGIQQSRSDEGARHLPLGVLLVEQEALTPSQLVQLLESEDRSGFRLSEDAVRLAMRMLAHRQDGTRLRLLFTGLAHGDGVTTIVSQVGLALALIDQESVVLVDTNVDAPGLHKRFHAPLEPGMIDVLAGRASLDEALFETGVTGLVVLPQGNCRSSGEKRLLLERSRQLLEDLSERFPVVLLDVPPIQTDAEATLFAREVDSVVLVAATGKHRKREFKDVLANLKGYRAKVEGVVLTHKEQLGE